MVQYLSPRFKQHMSFQRYQFDIAGSRNCDTSHLCCWNGMSILLLQHYVHCTSYVISSVRFIGLIYKYCVIVYRWDYKSNHDLENCPFVIRWTPTSGSPIAHWIVYLVLLALMWQNTTLMRVSQQLTASPRMFESDMWYSIIIILLNTPIGVRTVHAKC